MSNSTLNNYDKIFKEFKDIYYKSNQAITIFQKLVNLFNNLSEALQALFIPFTLQSLREDDNDTFSILEAVETANDYIIQFTQLLRFIDTFSRKLLQKPVTSTNESFSLKIDFKIKEVVDFYESITITGPQDQVDFVQKSYYAFLLLCRVFNTAIKIYNKEFPNCRIQELKNIPNLKYLDIESQIDLSNYIKEALDHKEQFFK